MSPRHRRPKEGGLLSLESCLPSLSPGAMETVLILCSLLAPAVLASGKSPLGPTCAELAAAALSGRRFWPFWTLG